MRMRFASIVVSDEDRAIDFYQGKLGFELLRDNPTPFGGRFLMFAPPGGGTKLVVSKPVPGMEGGLRVGGFTNISWETDDVQATYAELKAKGVSFPKPPEKTPWGGIEAIFADQDGNTFMLQQGGMD